MEQFLNDTDRLQGNILLDSIPECVKLINAEGIILYINKAGVSFIDASDPAEVIGKTVFEFIVPEYLTMWKNMHTRVCQGEQLNWEYEVVGVKGERRFLETRSVPHLLTSGIAVQLAITKDVTEKKRAAQAMEASAEKFAMSEARFRTLADNIQTLAWMADADGNVYWYNRHWFEYTGTTLEEMKGWGWEKLHHPDHLARVIAFMTEAWKKNVPFELIHLLRGKDGNYRWFLSRGTPICDSRGGITEWIGTLTDIDEQKRGEERFRLLADEAPLWVWLTDQDARMDYANKEMLAFFNASEVEVLNRQRLLGAVHADDLAHTTRINENGYATRNGYVLECRMFNNSTSQYEWFAIKTVPRLIEGRFHGFIGTATNIHVQKTYQAILEQKVAERTAALNKANAALQHSNQELQQFAHVASHDMKEPLRKISVFTELLQKELDNGDVDKAKEYAGRVASSTQRMNAFIESVLKYASIESHKAESVPVDLNQLVREVEMDVELALKDKNGTIIVKDILPVVNGMPVLLHQLFYNLINNALKFSKKHIPSVIELSTGKLATGEVAAKGLDHHRRYIVVCVKDNGIGFDQSHAKKIFDTYYRLNLKEKYEGTGLGLSLCKKIVERHGGTIEAEGISGEGALFKVILPLE